MSEPPRAYRDEVGAVVLAAGGSARLGRPKQLVMHYGLPLVVRAAQSSLEAGASPIVVVLGASEAAVRGTLIGLPIMTVFNPAWRAGMGTSLAVGVRAVLSRAPCVRGVLVTLADQPLVGDAALGRLLDAWADADARADDGEMQSRIAAAAYADTLGVPAVFGRAHFEALCSLPAGVGAAHLIRNADARAQPVAMPEAAMDVDTQGDVERLDRLERDAGDDVRMGQL